MPLKIKVFEIGSTLIDADPEYQEPDIRQAFRTGTDVAGTLIDLTDTERSDISGEEYAVVHEDDGTVLWRGWITMPGSDVPAPPQAVSYLAELETAKA